MKVKLLTALLVAAIAVAAIFYDRINLPDVYEGTPASMPNSAAAPDIAFKTLDGRAMYLAGMKEPAIILHFWASWCAPCITEFPALLARAAAEKGSLAIVAVSIDDDKDAMDRFVARQTVPADAHVYWVWDADKKLSLQYFDTVRVPESVLIDRHRRMAYKIAGDPGWNNPSVIQTLAGLAGR